MALFDDFTKKAARFTEDAIDKTHELAGTAKIKLKIKNIESNRDDVYRQLGEYYFNLIKNENSVNEDVANMREQIYQYQAEIEELKKQLDD